MLCRRPFTRLTRLQIFSAGPSFRPMYFIIMSLLSNSNAFPSISCFRNKSAWTASVGSWAAIKCITSSMVQSLVWPRGICGEVVTTVVPAGTIVVGIVSVVGVEALSDGSIPPTADGAIWSGIVVAAAGPLDEDVDDDDDDDSAGGHVWKGTTCGCVLWGIIVLATGVGVTGGGGTGAMFAVGVTWTAGEMAWAGDSADADDEAAAIAAATAAVVTELCRSGLTARLGVVARGGTTIVDDGVG